MSGDNTCRNCRYGIQPESAPAEPRKPLECRFNAPIPAIIITPGTEPIKPKAVWAIVDPEDWCANWNLRTEPGFTHP